MGNQLSAAFRFRKPKEYKVLVHGLENAGKTTVLRKMKLGEIVTTIPIIGFNVETGSVRGYGFTAWDIGGREGKFHRLIGRHYYTGTDALIFVIDSNDIDQIDRARDEFHRILNEPLLQNVPMLVFCNKQDLPNAMLPTEVSDRLGIFQITRRISVVGCMATTGKGLEEGMFFLARALESVEQTKKQVQDNDMNESQEVTTVDGEDFFLARALESVEQTKKQVQDNDMNESQEVTTVDDEVSVMTQLDFDPVKGNATLEKFSVIKKETECPFAKAAKLWGGKTPHSENNKDLEAQASDNVQALADFCVCSEKGEQIDGFCIELDDPLARAGGPEELGQCVKRMLTALADSDPCLLANNSKESNMTRVNYIGSCGWRFRFHNTDLFITTFAPCYPITSSRYAFGSDRAFLLLQPVLSFERHDLPEDTPHTDWSEPKTSRDKTRKAFDKAGRRYHIPNTTNYPMAEHIVKPIRDDGVSVVRWWVDKQQQVNNANTIKTETEFN